MNGGGGADSIIGSSFGDVINGGGGNDTVNGSGNTIDAVFIFDFERLLV